jgi:hypothetical protein
VICAREQVGEFADDFGLGFQIKEIVDPDVADNAACTFRLSIGDIGVGEGYLRVDNVRHLPAQQFDDLCVRGVCVDQSLL